MISGLNYHFQNLTSFSYLAFYSELSCVTYASFVSGGHIYWLRVNSTIRAI